MLTWSYNAMMLESFERNWNPRMNLMVLKLIFQSKNLIILTRSFPIDFPEEGVIWNYYQIPLRNTLEAVHFSVKFG